MIYTELTNKAMKLAYHAHEGQQDAGGLPYIFHPYHLAEQMNNETRTCIALLHDVVEDTTVTMDELRAEFPGAVTEALELLTHDEHMDYYEYVKRVCTNPDAAFVKLADLIHNISEDRLCGTDISTEERNRWFQKYIWALYIVTEAIEKYLEERCDYSRTGKEFHLYERIMSCYQGVDRRVVLCTEREPQNYLTEEQYATLKDLSVERQMNYFEVEIFSSREGSAKSDYRKTRKVPLKEFTDSYRYRQLITADGCIVGIMDMQSDLRDCKRAVQPFWVGSRERVYREEHWVDHSWDHYASVSEIEAYRLRWKQ